MFRTILFLLIALSGPPAQTSSHTEVERHIRAEMDFLASDEMQGRESASQFEAVAARYLASELERDGLLPGGDETSSDKSYLQNFSFNQTKASSAALKVGGNTAQMGSDFVITRLSGAQFSGPLQKWTPDKTIMRGAVVFVPADAANRSLTRKIISSGAVAVLIGFGPKTQDLFAHFKAEPATVEKEGKTNSLLLSQEMTNAISRINEGEAVTLTAKVNDVERHSRNVIAVLPGETDEVVMISAHYDHIGLRPGQADPIYNGADDDASGAVAVLQLAKKLSSGKKPRRTVYFVLFGSEELGSLGGDHFQKHLPVDLNKVVAQIEFEMIGRPDPKVNPGTLWMTGFERTDLGPELAKRGAALVGDPHPEQNFFERSDNFPMAKRGVVAQTISSYGLHPQYHQPDDDIAHIDFAHMTHAIESMIKPIEWFVNSDFKPQWKPGMKP
jgi:hypothetical protein